jgi:hypothetical protein
MLWARRREGHHRHRRLLRACREATMPPRAARCVMKSRLRMGTCNAGEPFHAPEDIN